MLPSQGDHFKLYYDDTALYFKNNSENDRPVNRVAFERLDKSHKAPSGCKKRQLVMRTPSLSDLGIFWTTQTGSVQFRVLWNNVEGGRCTIAAKQCDGFSP